MSLDISALLNPEPGSGSPSSKQNASVNMEKSQTPDAEGTRMTTKAPVLPALSSLALASPPRFTPSALPKDTTPPSISRGRHASIPQLPPLEPSPTMTNLHSSSPTLEQYHHASKSPEQRRRSEIERSHSPVQLAPLHALTGAPDYLQQQNEPPLPPDLPLFQPAPVQRRVNQTTSSSKPVQSQSPKSASPEAMGLSTAALKDIPDAETRAAVVAASNEWGLRGSRKPSEHSPPEIKPTLESLAPKKRAPPKSVAANKKGTAKKAAANGSKKRKAEPETTPARMGSETPIVRSKPPTKTRKSSASVADSSEVEDIDPEDTVMASDGDGDDVYCICQRGDDHSWMIACDGGCDNWFHGSCVNITETKGQLIDKYICPNCAAEGRGGTTWKPMCRREGCPKAARLSVNEVSKYCSEECGVKFMIQKAGLDQKGKRKSMGKTGRPSDIETKSGPLTPGQLKALVHSVPDAEAFRALGRDAPIMPSITTAGLVNGFDKVGIKSPTGAPASAAASDLSGPTFTPNEQTNLDYLNNLKVECHSARTALKERERYLSMVKDRLAAALERDNLKPKDLCGFDPRLSWATEKFARWRATPAGQLAYERGTLEGITDATNGGAMEVDGAPESAAEAVEMCTRKRCERHRNWQKLQMDDLRFEESQLADRLRELERKSKGVEERASMRWRNERSGLLQAQGSVEIHRAVQSV
ncbi:hypothetical protein BT63DRAFT_278768 [Microthyrium microscopicum]|uniref:PHD-type domain-containing protein n=1 Tax=Microthyrium microscopicum TaxID=703497 RepID=A0A6A6UA83_9PEZI|nr:hypothetical protein BT63DRAFT_278768 [Microthyrium microscopicum]